MQSAVGRDDFVKIKWSNIKSGHQRNFWRHLLFVSMFDTEYDYGSIMHYPIHAFTRNGEITIIPKKVFNGKIGQRDSKHINSGATFELYFNLFSNIFRNVRWRYSSIKANVQLSINQKIKKFFIIDFKRDMK